MQEWSEKTVYNTEKLNKPKCPSPGKWGNYKHDIQDSGYLYGIVKGYTGNSNVFEMYFLS